MTEFVLVGCWDRYGAGAGNGYVICRFDREAGLLERIGSHLPEVTVGQTCIDRRRDLVYCTDERSDLPGLYKGGGGQVIASRFDRRTGVLTEINRLPSYGSSPCHLALDPSGKFLAVTHHTERTPITQVEKDGNGRFRIRLRYDDATTVLFPVRDDGALEEPCDVHIHQGDGGPLRRQTHPQLHSVTLSPSGKLCVVCDKGNDEVQFFHIDHVNRRLAPCANRAFHSVPGSSPRYVAFHPSLPFLFVSHETKALITTLRYDDSGQATAVSSATVLPEGAPDDADTTKQSDLKVHPSGRFAFSLIRGTSSIAGLRINSITGSLERMYTIALDGLGPRGCAISPDGRFLLIACHGSGEVLVWNIAEDGRVSPTGRNLRIPNAGCIDFL